MIPFIKSCNPLSNYQRPIDKSPLSKSDKKLYFAISLFVGIAGLALLGIGCLLGVGVWRKLNGSVLTPTDQKTRNVAVNGIFRDPNLSGNGSDLYTTSNLRTSESGDNCRRIPTNEMFGKAIISIQNTLAKESLSTLSNVQIWALHGAVIAALTIESGAAEFTHYINAIDGINAVQKEIAIQIFSKAFEECDVLSSLDEEDETVLALFWESYQDAIDPIARNIISVILLDTHELGMTEQEIEAILTCVNPAISNDLKGL